MPFHGNSITKSFTSDNLHLHVNDKSNKNNENAKKKNNNNKYEGTSTSNSPQCGNVKCKFAGKRQTHILYASTHTNINTCIYTNIHTYMAICRCVFVCMCANMPL